MGSTFPVLLSGAKNTDHHVKLIGYIYGFNTFGAACGVLLCGFITIRFLGVTNSYLIAALLNLLSALSCFTLIKYTLPKEGILALGNTEPQPLFEIPQKTPEWCLIVATITSGFLVLAAEVLWFRLANFFLGNRTYALTTLLFCILIFLAAGSLLAPKLIYYFRYQLNRLFGYIYLTSSLLTVLSFWLSYWWIFHQASVEKSFPAHASYLIFFYRIIEAFIVMLPMMLPLGLLFPLSLCASRFVKQRPGFIAGQFYLLNTLGAVGGSLLMGQWALTHLGTMKSIYLFIIPCWAMATMFFCIHFAQKQKKREVLAILAIFLLTSLSLKSIPSHLTYLNPNEKLLYYDEDAYGIFQVVQEPRGTIKVMNNKMRLISRLGTKSGNWAQQMQGHLGMFFLENPKNILVIGGGYGITTGVLAAYPTVEKIDSIEILPGMIKSAHLFEPYNYHYYKHPKVNVIQDDGRHYLARTNKAYDFINVNITDPHLPGSSGLYHADFYSLIKKNLTPGGIVAQMAHSNGQGIKIVLKTLQVSFKHLVLFPVWDHYPWKSLEDYNFIVLASDTPLQQLSNKRLANMLSDPNLRKIFHSISINDVAELKQALTKVKYPDDYPYLFAESKIATDNHPLIEFFWDKNPSHILFRLYD